MAKEGRGLAVIGAEHRALDKIPAQTRVFGFWDQLALWFGAASPTAAWSYGALMAGWQGLLPVGWGGLAAAAAPQHPGGPKS